MSEHALRVAVVGCGNISGAYGETMGAYPSVRIAGATDVDRALSAAFVDRFGGVDYPSLDDVLDDPAVDAIVNLTFPAVHAEVTTAALERGEARAQREAARRQLRERPVARRARGRPGLRLSCSPITFMGEAQETMWRLVDAGAIGRVRVAYAEVNWSRIESWHPRPEPFYRHRAVRGRRRVSAHDPHGHVRAGSSGHGVRDGRLPRSHDDGRRAVLAGGTRLRRRRGRARERDDRASDRELLRRHARRKQRGIELHGDTGSIHLSDWQLFDATVELARFGEPYEAVPVEDPFPGTDWGRALGDLSDAIVTGRPHRATGAHAAHIVEILDATTTSVAEGRAVDITSSFARPELGSNGSRPT